MAIQTINGNSVQPLGEPNSGTSTEMGDTWGQAVTKLNAMFVELYGASTYTGAKIFTSTVSVQAGGATGTNFGVAGNLTSSVSTIGSSATNTTQTLVSYTLPASTLNVTGNGLLVTAWGRKAGNAAGVTFALNVGGTNINTGNGTQSGVTWVMTAEVFKKSSNAQQELYTAQVGTVFTTPKSTSDTSTDTGTITISVTALDASAGQSNVLLDGFIVEYFQ